MPEVCRRGISLNYGLLAYVVRLLPTGTQETVTVDLVKQVLQQMPLLIDWILLRHTALSGELLGFQKCWRNRMRKRAKAYL